MTIEVLQNKRQPPRILRKQLELQEAEIASLEKRIEEISAEKKTLQIEFDRLKQAQ